MATASPVVRLASEPDEIVYPTSDGKPMADNTLQWDWIVLIKNGLEAVFEDRPDVFIASDFLWYPVQGSPAICAAPDVMVAFGRPKGTRGAYLQWQEENIPFQVTFEILSPSNTRREMDRKREFYERYGVLEYYVYNPGAFDKKRRVTSLKGWQRGGPSERFAEIEQMNGWRSPLLGITFLHDPHDELQLLRPDGETFESYRDVIQRANEIARRAEENARRADENARRADENAQRAQDASLRNERLLAQLRAAGIEPADDL